jgi:hypothetical protein
MIEKPFDDVRQHAKLRDPRGERARLFAEARERLMRLTDISVRALPPRLRFFSSQAARYNSNASSSPHLSCCKWLDADYRLRCRRAIDCGQ